MAALASFKQENCHNKSVWSVRWHLSGNLQNLLKNKERLPAENFENIFTLDKESKRKSNHLCQQTVLLKIIFIWL